jgi:hypothetical protein
MTSSSSDSTGASSTGEGEFCVYDGVLEVPIDGFACIEEGLGAALMCVEQSPGEYVALSAKCSPGTYCFSDGEQPCSCYLDESDGVCPFDDMCPDDPDCP